MFGIFKKKENSLKNTFITFSENEKIALSHASELIKMSLFVCDHDPNEMIKLVNTTFFRGYVIGHLEAALQSTGWECSGIGEAIVKLSYGVSKIFDMDEQKANNFVLTSISMQSYKDFEDAKLCGGTEYFDFMNKKINAPQGISKYYLKNF